MIGKKSYQNWALFAVIGLLLFSFCQMVQANSDNYGEIITLGSIGNKKPEDIATLRAQVRNTGNRTLGPTSEVVFWVQGGQINQIVGSISCQGLPAGDSGWYGYDWTIPANAAFGRYKYWAIIKENGNCDWVVKQSQKLYPKWLKANYNDSYARTMIEILVAKDQEDRVLYDYLKRPDSIITILDLGRIFELRKLCERINTFPNDFDNGVGTYYRAQFLLAHSLKSADHFFQSWELLFPYLEKAYFDDKISGSFFKLYDTFHYRHFGTQYYGTLGKEVPVKDEYELNKRKLKYNL